LFILKTYINSFFNLFIYISLCNDKITFDEIINKGDKNKLTHEKYKLLEDCFEKYLDIINKKLVENIEQNMVLKINIKDILDLNLMNNNNVKYYF